MKHRDMRRFQQIGLDRLIRLDWLRQTAKLVMAGDEIETIKKFLLEYIKSEFPFSDASVRGSIDKTLTILMKIWARPPNELVPLRDDGLKVLQKSTVDEELAIHWGMTMAVYPFWGAVATSTGRLLDLQSQIAASQVQRRLRERYGERQTVSRRVRYMLRSFIDWGVLEETSKKGTYQQSNKIALLGKDQIVWLIEAYLYTIPEGISDVGTAFGAKSLFPFDMHSLSGAQIAVISGRIELNTHGLDKQLLKLI
jgi:hypothetical protein